MLEFKCVSKEYGRRQRAALREVTFSAQPGEILGLVGLNGAGKTSSIRIASGVALATAGDVLVEGHSITKEKASASRYIGWVPEAPVHDNGATIGRLIRYYAGISGLNPAEGADAQLRIWGIEPLRNRIFRTLSLGERKRFALAVACIHDPLHYLLDEVFNGLDPTAVAQVREWMFVQRNARKGLLVSSHQLREVQAIADRVAILHEGRLLRLIRAEDVPTSRLRRLQITFAPTDRAAIDLLSTFGKVEQGRGSVTLSGEAIDGGVVNRALVQAGYVVSRLEAADPDLETFFLRLIAETD